MRWFVCSLHFASFVNRFSWLDLVLEDSLRLGLLETTDEGTKIFRTVCKYLPIYVG